jgi:methylmalonyl-CoA mutase, N-terminal domain
MPTSVSSALTPPYQICDIPNIGIALTSEAVTDAERWFREKFARTPQRDALFSTLSGEPVEPLYTEADLPEPDRIGLPGEFPFTRGVYPSMYRGRLWTMRQFAGFGTAEETNERFRYLRDHGQTGLSTAFDMPSLMGHDSDHPRSLGEVGREGVAVDSLDDMETLFAGIPLGEVSVSMTINAPAAVMLAFYVVAAERQGVGPERLAGTIQTDILKEYIAQKEWCFPIEPAMGLVTDMVEFCARRMPRWHPISISGYHIREAGSTAQQELAFTLKDGFTYVERAVERGLDVDEFAPRLSFFFNAHIDFFEEIAKYRAARRIWARELRDSYGARDERSLLMRFHTQTAGVSLTAQQPLNNVVRTATEALSAVLGGTQSLHTNSFDEALALPTEEAVRVALRTQQILAHETGVANTIDPLGGSYFVEALTDRMEEAAYAYFAKVDELGGMVSAIEQNYPQREIAEASFRLQEEIERGERIVVGVNRYQHEDEAQMELLRIPPELERKQIGRVQAVKASRDGQAAEAALTELRDSAAASRNLMEPLLDAARAHCTEGEIVESLQRVYGTYTETPVF